VIENAAISATALDYS